MRHTFDCKPPRMISEVWMNMWGQIMPKKVPLEYPTMISTEALMIFTSEDDHAFVALAFPYAWFDWKQFPNILFIVVEPSYDRGNIRVFFRLS